MHHFTGKENRSYWMGLGFILVFLYHMLFPAWPGATYKVLLQAIHPHAEVCISIFLFLSAYGLCHSFTRHDLRTFYVNRLRRLLPIYPVFFVAWAALGGIDGSPLHVARQLAEQLSGIACLRQSTLEWYIPALVLVYLTFPWLYRGLKWLYDKRLPWLYGLIVFLTVGTLLFQQVMRIHLAKQLPYIALGITTYLCEQRDDRNNMVGLYAVAGLASIFSSWYAWGAMVFYGVKFIPFRLPLRQTLSFLGRHTLELYLAQHIAFRCYYIPYHDTPMYQRLAVVLLVTAVGATVLWAVQYYFWHAFATKKATR